MKQEKVYVHKDKEYASKDMVGIALGFCIGCAALALLNRRGSLNLFNDSKEQNIMKLNLIE